MPKCIVSMMQQKKNEAKKETNNPQTQIKTFSLRKFLNLASIPIIILYKSKMIST